MKRNPQVIAYMTPFPHSIDIDAPLAQAREMMRKGDFRHLPVTSGGAIVGIVTDRDIKLLLGPDFGNPDERELKVYDAYIDKPCVVPASTSLATIARTMAQHHIGSVIVTKNDKLVGIFTVTDACRALAEIIEGHPSETDSVA